MEGPHPDIGTAPPDIRVRVEPGICGFDCVVEVWRVDKRTVKVAVSGSQCQQVQRLSGDLTVMSLRELFTPMTRNPVYTCAEKSGCHPSCAIPAAVLKAVEAAMGMAIARDVRIRFDTPRGGDR